MFGFSGKRPFRSEHKGEPVPPGMFRCNICGQDSDAGAAVRHRELFHCTHCGSNARFRGMAKALIEGILGFGDGRALAECDANPSIRGIGMSDADCYATHLARLFCYTNTYYHTEPRLDITDVQSAQAYTGLDFVICSDVLEHVHAPVSVALDNLHRMLKPGGRLLLTVPYVEGHETIEHFPHLHDYRIVELSGTFVLVNRRRDGIVEMHQGLSFHGGPGSVLELRILGEGDLLAMLREAGFVVTVLEASDEAIGYAWEDGHEYVLAGNRKSKSYVLSCLKP